MQGFIYTKTSNTQVKDYTTIIALRRAKIYMIQALYHRSRIASCIDARSALHLKVALHKEGFTYLVNLQMRLISFNQI